MIRQAALNDLLAAPQLARLRSALEDLGGYLVGGTVRDALLGLPPHGDLDIAVEGDLEPLLVRLGAPARRHDRFGTATVELGDLRLDLARTRAESYERPGALPDVEPAALGDDLARRDFTVNAMALPLDGAALIDPHGGRADLDAGLIRVLHRDSFRDDPTRAVRAARYAARLALEPEPETLRLLSGADLGSVSADRARAELARLVAEPEAGRGFRLLATWGALEPAESAVELIAEIDRRIAAEPAWSADPATRSAAIMLAALGGDRRDAALRLAAAVPERPSEAVRLAEGHSPGELLLAAAAGGRWLDSYAREWSRVSLEIDGEDLLGAGIPEGPAVGAGLRAALDRKLDGGLLGGREAELEAALEVAREPI